MMDDIESQVRSFGEKLGQRSFWEEITTNGGSSANDHPTVNEFWRNLALSWSVVCNLLERGIQNEDYPLTRALVKYISRKSGSEAEKIPSEVETLLCSLLSLRNWQVDYEDIIELLGEIRAVDSVSTLEGVVWDKDFPYIDENYWAAKKALWSLFQIGSNEAIEVIKKATAHPEPEIAEEASIYLS